jgi:uncharacterized protein (TIGR03083 family)
MAPDAYLAHLARLQSVFTDMTADCDPGAVVPGLGNWPVRELVAHLAGIHRWAGGMAQGDDSLDDEVDVVGLDAAALSARYAGFATALHETLARLGPHATCRTLTGPGPVSFWFRRQAHETLVHLGDLAAARSGRWSADVLDGVVDIPDELWADGVEEVVTVFEPRQVRLGRMRPLPRLICLRDAGTGHTWVLGGDEDDRVAEEPAATVAAPARELDLLLWGRIGPASAGVTVTGDPAAVTDALTAGIVP